MKLREWFWSFNTQLLFVNYIIFSITSITQQELIKVLPERPEPMEIPSGEVEVENCHLKEYNESQRGRSSSNAYAESDDEEDGGFRQAGGPGGPGMQCATQ